MNEWITLDGDGWQVYACPKDAEEAKSDNPTATITDGAPAGSECDWCEDIAHD